MTAYSNDTTKLDLRGITKYLAEGSECKEILIQRNIQLRIKDSIIQSRELKITSLTTIDTINRVIIQEHQKKDAKMTKKNSIKNNIILTLIFATIVQSIYLIK